MDYLARIKQDPLAVKVKLGDLRHNSDLGRLSMIDEKACSLHERYKKAIAFLTKE